MDPGLCDMNLKCKVYFGKNVRKFKMTWSTALVEVIIVGIHHITSLYA